MLNLQTITQLATHDILRLCVKALEANIEVETVQKLIKTLSLAPDKSASKLESWPWRVRIYTLGSFSIQIDGVTLTASGKEQKKPLLLLKALIAYGAQNVSREMLATTLWPDSEGDEANQALSTTLHRLRKLLGQNCIIQHQGLLSLAKEHCWSDIGSFEHYLSSATHYLACDRPMDAWNDTAKALDIYKGDFLQNENAYHWRLSKSERSRRKLIQSITKVCSRLHKNDHYELAIEGYLQGLDIDDLQEDFYEGLIICYKKMGKEAEAKSIYEQYRRLITTIVGCPPAKRITLLFENQKSFLKPYIRS